MFLFYALILLIPFNNHPLLSQPVMGLTPIKWVGAALVIYAFFYMNGKKSQIPVFRLSQALLFILLIFLVVFSLAVNHIPIAHNLAFGRYIALIPFFFASVVLIDTRKKFHKVLFMTVVAMCIGTAYIVRDSFFYGGIYGAGFRPGGSFGDANYYALSAVIVVPISYFIFKANDNFKIRAFALGALGFIVLGIILSLSKGGMIALFIALFMIMMQSKKKLKGLILGLVVVFFVGIFLMPTTMLDRFVSMKSTIVVDSVDNGEGGGDLSTKIRMDLLKAGIEMIKESPLQGVGVGMFKPTAYEYVGISGIACNSYIEVAAETGIPALLVFLAIIITTIRDLRRLGKFYRNEYTGVLCQGLMIGFIAAVVAAIFLSAQNEKLLWLSVFLTLSLKRIALSEPALEEQKDKKEEKSGEIFNVSAV